MFTSDLMDETFRQTQIRGQNNTLYEEAKSKMRVTATLISKFSTIKRVPTKRKLCLLLFFRD